MISRLIGFLIGVMFTLNLQAETCIHCMNTFVIPTGVELGQFKNVLSFLDGEKSSLSETEKEYWKLRQEFTEVATSTLKKVMENDDAIEKKLLGILKEITGRSGTTVSEILKVDYFTETDQKKITDAIKKMTPKDPGLDSVADLLKKRGDEILGQLKKLNQEIQNKSKKDPAKIEFYKGQALYDDINSESFTKNYLYIRHNRLSTLNMIAINNNYAKAEIDYHSSNTPEKHLKDYEQFARKDLMIGLENIASAYAGKKTLSGAKLPKEMWSRETALKYAKEAYEQGSKFGAELIADIHPDDSQGLRYAIILSKIGNKKAPLTLESAKKFYGKSTDIDLYLKAGLIKQ